MKPERKREVPAKRRGSSDALLPSGATAAKVIVAISVRVAVAARDASTHLTEWDEIMAVETRGGAEAYMETLCNVLGVGIQLDDFARRTFVR